MEFPGNSKSAIKRKQWRAGFAIRLHQAFALPPSGFEVQFCVWVSTRLLGSLRYRLTYLTLH